MNAKSENLLDVRNLHTHFLTSYGVARAVDGIDFHVAHGETLALVGESGSGKSVTGLSIMGLIDEPGRIVAGEIRLGGADLLKLGEKEMDALTENVVMTGGVVAHNPYLVKMTEEIIGRKILVPDHPQLTGAIGAALYAMKG